MIDTSRTLKIEGSPAKLLGLVGLGLFMMAVSVWVLFLPIDPFRRFVAAPSGIVFFGLCTSIAVWRLLNSSHPVITISPEGILDTRVTAAPIPWSAVTRISTWSSRGRKHCVVLAIEPSVEARLGLTHIARWTRAANRTLGADGLCITAAGLKVDHNTLLRACQDYAQHARDNRLGRRPIVPQTSA